MTPQGAMGGDIGRSDLWPDPAAGRAPAASLEPSTPPGLLRGVMDGSAEAAPENAAQHKRGRQKGYSRGADGRVLPDDRRFSSGTSKIDAKPVC